jgi:hypothetical protein
MLRIGVPAFRVGAVRQDNHLIDRAVLACLRGYADALFDARTIKAHSPVVTYDSVSVIYRTSAISLFLNTFFPSLNPAVARKRRFLLPVLGVELTGSLT